MDTSGTSETCRIGRVRFVHIPDAFMQIIPAGEDPNNQEQCNVLDVRKCEVPLVVSVVGMEHINVANVAITALRASCFDYSPDTGQMPGTHLVNFTS